MTQVPVSRCQYCGSQDIGEGWQHGEAWITFNITDCWEINGST